jgi:hypothetical protein
MKFPSLDQDVQSRLTHGEHVARDVNARVPLTRRCAYPKSAPALAGGCICWGCFNVAAIAKQHMLQTSPLPQNISFKNERPRGHVIK